MPDMSLHEVASSFNCDKLAPLVTSNCSLKGNVDKQNRDFGTLDDVPDFALRDMKALYSLMFQRFEKFDGQVQYGPVTIGVFDDGYWGRQMLLPSQEVFQLRFAPKDLVSNSEQRVVLFATRTVSMTGQSAVSNAVLFRPEIPSESHEPVEASGRPVGCKGLHVMMAAFFKRHNPGIGGPNCLALPTNGVAYDPFGYQAVRATTYSVHKSDRKGLERSSDHSNACSATSGSSILTIAGELVDTHLTPIVARAAMPTAFYRWKQDCADFKAEIMSAARSPQLGNSAILSAVTIAELLSAEGMVSMAANPFFEGARPDRFFMPHGVPLSIVMAVRLAMHWEHYGLPRPCRTDMAANDQLRMLFESTSYGPLPLLEECNYWAIDLVIRGAMRSANLDVAQSKRSQNVTQAAPITVLDDQKVFYQRVGQRLITSTFGLGSNVVLKPESKYGSPWRFQDPLQVKRLQYLADPNRGACTFDGLDQPSITVSSIGRCRTELVRMMLSTEEWIRTGEYNNQRITPENGSIPIKEQVSRIKVVVGAMMLPGMVGKIAATAGQSNCDDTIEDALAKALLTSVNINGLVLAINESKEFLMHGPVTHFKYMCGAYVVAPTQSSACCDCETPIHVLQGVMLANRYGECTGCHARRCLQCAEAYAKAVQVTEPQAVGKRCHACGAEPAWVDVVKTTEAGFDTFRINLGPRLPWRQGASLEPIETGGAASSSAPLVSTKTSASPSTGRKKSSRRYPV